MHKIAFSNPDLQNNNALLQDAADESHIFLANVYGKLEEAKQDMKNGKYSSVEDAVARIRKKHGL